MSDMLELLTRHDHKPWLAKPFAFRGMAGATNGHAIAFLPVAELPPGEVPEKGREYTGQLFDEPSGQPHLTLDYSELCARLLRTVIKGEPVPVSIPGSDAVVDARLLARLLSVHITDGWVEVWAGEGARSPVKLRWGEARGAIMPYVEDAQGVLGEWL